MNAQSDHSSSRVATSSDARRRSYRLHATTRQTSAASGRPRVLFVKCELRSGRHHLARADVHHSDMTVRRLKFRRRSNYRRVWGGQPSGLPLCQVRRRRDDISLHRGSNDAILRKLYLRRRSNDLGFRRDKTALRGPRRIQWHLRKNRSRGHDIRHRHIVVELDIGRHDDGLRTVIRLLRDRKDRLFRVNRVSLLGFLRFGTTRVKRRQILLRRIRHERRSVKGSAIKNLLLPDPGERNCPDQRNRTQMQRRRLQESPPRQRSLDKNIAPEVEVGVAAVHVVLGLDVGLDGRFLGTQCRPNPVPEFRTGWVMFHQKLQKACLVILGFHLAPSCVLAKPKFRWCPQKAGSGAMTLASPDGYSVKRL